MKGIARKIMAVVAAVTMLAGLAGCGEDTADKMPKVVGKDYSDAVALLNKKGYSLVSAVDGNGVAATDGVVKKQSPKAGAEADPETTSVQLTVESASEKQQKEASAKDDKIEELSSTLTGSDATDAIKQLQDADILGTITKKDGTQVSVDEIETDAKNGVKWVVTSTVKHTIVSQSVDLIVDTQANADAQSKSDQMAEQLEQKLSKSAALAACREYGKQKYPYGFKTHDITGVLQPMTPKDANTWFYKATADVTNVFGANAKGMNYECTVTGTTASPQVVEFNVY